MTPEVILAFVLGIIGGFVTAVLIIWRLVSKLIGIAVVQKSDKKIDKIVDDIFDEDK